MRFKEYLQARDDVFESELVAEMLKLSIPKELAQAVAATAIGNARNQLDALEPDSIKDFVERAEIPLTRYRGTSD